MRQAACIILALFVLTLPYRLAMRSHKSYLDSGMISLELSAREATAGPIFDVGSAFPPAADLGEAEAQRTPAANNPPPVFQSDAAASTTGSEDWYGLDSRPPVVLTHPNPFRVSTRIAYTLPHATHALVTVYNAFGREVARLTDGFREEGTYLVTLDASRLQPGRYVCVLETVSTTVAKEIVLSR